MDDNKLVITAVTQQNWHDLESLFESRGGPKYCWCMVWRNMLPGTSRQNGVDKKNSLHHYVDDDIPVGLLAFVDAAPVGWCSIAPRDSYRNLGGDKSLPDVWSLVCFFIKKEFRAQGLTIRFINAALDYAKQNGARYVEAYPVEADSPSYHFMGFKPVFEKMGFEFQYKVGQRRNVMIKKLEE